MPDPIDLITADPDINKPDQIEGQLDLFVQQLKARIPQMNTGLLAMNLNSLSSVTADNLTVSLSQVTTTIETDKSFLPGHIINVAKTSDPIINMKSTVISYNPVNGSLVFDPFEKNGTGSHTGWTVTFAGIAPTLSDNEISLRLNNGMGAVNTAIQRYAVVEKDTSGDFMTYTTDSNLGDSVTINVSGDYQVYRYGALVNATSHLGVSVNSGGLTTSFITRMNTNPEEFVLGFVAAAQTQPQTASRIMRFNAGDVIRPHNHNSSAETDNGFISRFGVKRIGIA